MAQLLKELFQSFSRIFRRQTYQNILKRISYNDYNKTSETEIKDVLKQRFPKAKSIEVKDTSSCAAMFLIIVETDEFKEMSVFDQHKAVYVALNDKIKVIYGLHVITKVAKK